MTTSAEPGLHDPYWYEAALAERFTVKMLDEASGIRNVTIQAPAISAIDDVVVQYENRRAKYYQVKHTRTKDPLTFADLTGLTDGRSLLRQLAEGWKKVAETGVECEPHLYTNRELGTRRTRRHPTADGAAGMVLPPLAQFWVRLSELASAAVTIDEITVPEDMGDGWQLWRKELGELSSLEQLRFLQTLHIQAGQPDLAALRDEVLARLSSIFGISKQLAEQGLAQLDTSLPLGNIFTWQSRSHA